MGVILVACGQGLYRTFKAVKCHLALHGFTIQHGVLRGFIRAVRLLAQGRGKKHIMISTPDLAAYLVLLYEACGKLAVMLEKPESEAELMFDKSRTMQKNLIDILWDGKCFTALIPETGQLLYSDSIIHYMPVILGDRLPSDILDKLVKDLSDTQTFFSPWGIASEKKTSRMFSPFGWGRGCVLPPAMLFIVTGLWDTAHRELARSAAENYCKTLADTNFPFFIDSKTGDGMYYGCSWANCAYTVLARLVSET